MNVARIGIPRCRNLLGFAIETLTLQKGEACPGNEETGSLFNGRLLTTCKSLLFVGQFLYGFRDGVVSSRR